MTTPPIELAATVECIERKQPPEPEGWITLVMRSNEPCWYAVAGRVEASKKIAERNARIDLDRGFPDVRLVRIGSPAPSPAETGAVPGIPSEETRRTIHSALLRLDYDGQRDPLAHHMNAPAALAELRRIWGEVPR